MVSEIIYMALMVSIITFLLSLLLTNYYPGHRIAQVHVVFEIPSKMVQEHQLFRCDVASPMYLAYIEWFSPLSASRDVNHLMYKVTKQVHKNQDSRRSVAIIPVNSILCSIHLLPQFRSATRTYSALENCDTFFVNPFSDRYNYLTFM